MVETKREALAAAVDDGAVVLAVCGGYQLLGHSYQLGEEKLPGLGLADLETVREPGPRLIGNVAIEADLGAGPRLLAGFENHGGRTYLGRRQPLGRVVKGHGNNGRDGLEGVRRHNLIGTYLHGPLLPKNAWLADHLIALALERRYGERPQLGRRRRDFEARRRSRAPERCHRRQLQSITPKTGKTPLDSKKAPLDIAGSRDDDRDRAVPFLRSPVCSNDGDLGRWTFGIAVDETPASVSRKPIRGVR